MHQNQQNIFGRLQSIFLILKKPSYALLAGVVAVSLATISFGLAVRSIVALSFQFPASNFAHRILITLENFRAVPLNLSTSAIMFILGIAFLTGVNIALVVYYFRQRAQFFRGSPIGFLGVASGIIGIGCSSCGSVILSSFIGLSASWTLIGALPLRGAEFSILAIALLLYSIFSLSQKLSPERIMACDI